MRLRRMRTGLLCRTAAGLLAAVLCLTCRGAAEAAAESTAAFQPLYGEGTDEAAVSRGELRLRQLARALAAFRARAGEELPLAVLSGCGQTFCNRIGDARFPDTLSAVCLEEFPECFGDAYRPDAICLSAAENALCAPDAVGGAVRVTRNGEDIPGEITAVIGDFVFSK